VPEEKVPDNSEATPNHTALRTALWRALHLEADAAPHVFEDRIGLQLAAPDEDWRERPDMSPFTRPFRASIVARARFVEDLVAEQVALGVGQYVILGAGLDTFALRQPELAARLRIFEVDQPGPQEWKRQRLVALGFGVPSCLRWVPVDFEAGAGWWEQLLEAEFDAGQPAIVASTGVSMYLTRNAIAATLRQVAALVPGSVLVMSFMLPIEMVDPEIRVGVERAAAGAPAAPPSSASSRRTKCWRWPGRPASGKSAMCRPRHWPSATSRTGPMACDRRTIRKNCWWRSPDRLSNLFQQ
jgi:methyltransferase (TIGR00027 family)